MKWQIILKSKKSKVNKTKITHKKLTKFLIFLIETILRTEDGQRRPKYIFNNCGTNIYFFYSTEVWSITIA